MAWDAGDYALAAAMVAGTSGAYALAVRKTANTAYRAGTAIALLTAFLLVWVNGAVGIIGAEDNEANLLYGGVLLLGLAGAVIGRFRPSAMARTLLATACAQGIVGAIALVAGWGSSGPIWMWDVVFATAFFSAMWLVAAWLFQKAARQPPMGTRQT